MSMESILDLLEEQFVAGIAVCNETNSWSFNCFYAYEFFPLRIIFMSGESRHTRLLNNSPSISGTIFNNNRSIQMIKGIQFTGTARRVIDNVLSVRNVYESRFPESKNIPGQLWVIDPEYVKLTDNSVHFGYKFDWWNEVI